MKLLAFDIDDTILNSHECISERNKKAITLCRERGNKIGFITARSPRKVEFYLQGISYDFISYYNGASTFADNTLISDKSMPYYEAIATINKIQASIPEINMSVYFEPYCYRRQIIQNMLTNEIIGCDMANAPQCSVQRIHISLDKHESHNFSQYIHSSMKYVETRHKTAIITSVDANKGNALKSVIDYFRLSQNDVFSFGDDISDIPMFKESGIGIAMKNSHNDLKAVSDYVTLSCDEDGVAHYIEQFVLQ